MNKGYCNHTCKHFKSKHIYNFIEHKDENGKLYWREREYVGMEYYCEKCNDRYKEFVKELDKNYRHKSVIWLQENVTMDCYEPTETTALLNGMVHDLKELVENIK